jgi:hypothetical protein
MSAQSSLGTAFELHPDSALANTRRAWTPTRELTRAPTSAGIPSARARAALSDRLGTVRFYGISLCSFGFFCIGPSEDDPVAVVRETYGPHVDVIAVDGCYVVRLLV